MKKIFIIFLIITIMIFTVSVYGENLEYSIEYNIEQNEQGYFINVSLNTQGLSEAWENSVFIVGLYSNENYLDDVKTLTIGQVNEIEMPVTDCENQKIKVMAFESYGSLKPLGEMKEIRDLEPYNREKVIYINGEENKEFNIYLTSENTKTAGKSVMHKITYNPQKLTVVDLCSLTYAKEVSAGAISNTDIIVEKADFENGEIILRFHNENQNRTNGINNIITFKALQSLTAEEIVYLIK